MNNANMMRELKRVTVRVGNKTVLLMLRQNEMGCYLKMFSGPIRITVPHSGLERLREAFGSALHVLQAPASAVPTAQVNNGRQSQTLYSKVLVFEGRKFYFDVFESKREGVVFKLLQASPKKWIMGPATAVAEFYEGLLVIEQSAAEHYEVPDDTGVSCFQRKYPQQLQDENGETVVVNLLQHDLHIDGKRILIESRVSQYGSFLRFLDCTTRNRVSLTVPYTGISQLIASLKDIEDRGDPLDQLS